MGPGSGFRFHGPIPIADLLHKDSTHPVEPMNPALTPYEGKEFLHSKDREAFSRLWVDTQIQSLFDGWLKGFTVFQIIAALSFAFWCPPLFLPYFSKFFVLCFFATAAVYYFTTTHKIQPAQAWLYLQIILGFLMLLTIKDTLFLNLELSVFINLIIIYFGASLYSTVGIPQPMSLSLKSLFFNILISLAACSGHHELPFLQVAAILIFTNLLTLVVNHSRYQGLLRESSLVYDARSLMIKNEQMSRENLEKEFRQAQEIQDSFLPPPEQFETKHLRVQYYQEKYGFLGGDWMALRLLPSGDLLSLVIDVTGKGTAAALVVHAVQSLWIQASHQQHFDPIAWILKVNRVLKFMGEKSSQTLTLGMIILSKNHGTYYSAGHIPLFMAKKSGRDTSVRSILGRGDILGLKDHIEIHPVVFPWNESEQNTILLATDGVFPHGTLTRSKEVIEIIKHLKQNPNPLKAIDSKDDKLLLLIQTVAHG